MLEGLKTVELRRRPVRVTPGTRVWIYSTTPRARLDATGVIQGVHESHPNEIWQRFGSRSGVSRSDFDGYFAGARTACAIVLTDIAPLAHSLSLGDLRRRVQRFHPPQFFKKLEPGSQVLACLESI
jgi:predicted transcriptional regulator